MDNTKIIQNAAKCAKCGDEVWSAHRHDYRECKCGAIAVDGGLDYLRRVGELGDFLDRSVSVSEGMVKDLKGAVEWARETGRNDLGCALAVIRVLQNHGVVGAIYSPEKIF